MADVEQGAVAGARRERREAIVREHMESENHHDLDAAIATFSHPRYEIIATGDVFDGEQEVRGYFAETRAAFPGQRNELIALHHTDEGVVVEFDLLGTHLGRLRSLGPTGRAFRCRMTAFFIFDDERIVCERVYFDPATILRQLGLSHDPTSVAGRISTLLEPPRHDRSLAARFGRGSPRRERSHTARRLAVRARRRADDGPYPVVLGARIEAGEELQARAVPALACTIARAGNDRQAQLSVITTDQREGRVRNRIHEPTGRQNPRLRELQRTVLVAADH